MRAAVATSLLASLLALSSVSFVLAKVAYNDVTMLCLVNKERAREGLRPLGLDAKLTKAARAHSEDQARTRNMSHTGSDGSDPSARADDVGFNWKSIAENVAYGYDSMEEVMQTWMDSPGHRENILGSDYTVFGSGVAYNGNTPYFTQMFGSDGSTPQIPKCDGTDSMGGAYGGGDAGDVMSNGQDQSYGGSPSGGSKSGGKKSGGSKSGGKKSGGSKSGGKKSGRKSGGSKDKSYGGSDGSNDQSYGGSDSGSRGGRRGGSRGGSDSGSRGGRRGGSRGGKRGGKRGGSRGGSQDGSYGGGRRGGRRSSGADRDGQSGGSYGGSSRQGRDSGRDNRYDAYGGGNNNNSSDNSY